MIDESTLISIRASYRSIYPADQATPIPGIICPLCGSGSGPHGTGITEDPQHPGHLHCWHCGFDGDVIDLIMQDPNVHATTFAEAVAWAAAQAGISIEQTQTSFLQASQSTQSATDGLEEPEAQKYLASRGISVETARGAGARYERAWRHPSVPTSVPTSPRIIIPTEEGSAVTRDIRSSAQLDAHARKYAKQNVGPARLLGSKTALAQPEPIFVVEGAFDALSVREAGAQAISLGSTANAGLLVEAVRRATSVPPLILTLDRDDAGQRAQSALYTALNEMGVAVTTYDLSGSYKDPNDALVADREGFTQRVQSAIVAARKMISEKIVTQYTLTYEQYMATVTAASDLIPTGIDLLDKALGGGLCPFGLTILGGRTGTGKTSLALQIAAHVIADGRPVLYVPLEMTSVQLASKLIVHSLVDDPFAPGPGITALDLLTGHISDAVRSSIETYFSNVAPRLFVMERHRDMHVAEIGELGAQIEAAMGMPPLIVVDYFQILPVDDPRMQDRHAINANVDTLKAASAKYPILILSAFNRTSYHVAAGSSTDQVDHESIINSMESAYKETANLEYTAETLLGLRTVNRYNDMTDIDLYVIKHRWNAKSMKPVGLTLHGPSGSILQRDEVAPPPAAFYF